MNVVYIYHNKYCMTNVNKRSTFKNFYRFTQKIIIVTLFKSTFLTTGLS